MKTLWPLKASPDPQSLLSQVTLPDPESQVERDSEYKPHDTSTKDLSKTAQYHQKLKISNQSKRTSFCSKKENIIWSVHN